jgi:hypothetical protein
MSDPSPIRQEAPAITLRQISAERDAITKCWNIAWRLENKAAHPLQVLAVNLPHGQFKSLERRFEPSIELKVGEEKDFQTPVHCDEPPGIVTENAFAIFQTVWKNQPWRIFVRLQVVVNSAGMPEAAVESTTTQRIGFSGTSC